MAVRPATITAQELGDQAEVHFATKPPGSIFIPRKPSNDGYEYRDEAEAFPPVNPLLKPLGSRLLVQLRMPLRATSAGMTIPDETYETDMDNTQVGKVIAVGGLAFRNRETGQQWPEGAWCKVGDYVRIPKFQQDLFRRPYQRTVWRMDGTSNGLKMEVMLDHVRFAQVRDLDITAIYPDAETALIERAFI